MCNNKAFHLQYVSFPAMHFMLEIGATIIAALDVCTVIVFVSVSFII